MTIRVLLVAMTACASLAISYAQPIAPPENMVTVEVLANTDPSPGGIYLAPNCRLAAPPFAPYFVVLDNDGVPVQWKQLPEYAFDSRILPDGRIGYSVFQSAGTGARVTSTLHRLDSNLASVDTLKAGNSYPIAMHNFTVLPNGNRLIICQENLTVDMRSIVEGGHPAASVQQMLVQEVTPSGLVIFQFRTLDHLPIEASFEDLKAASIRPFHLNAICEDTDGNFLMSIRHSSMILKVRRTTGDIMWILGGKLNQFTFIGEHEEHAPHYFSYQHDIRRLPNGNITIFDNGTQKKPQYSRAVEYKLDEQAKTCELIWEYRHTPDIYTSLQGAVQTLPDGHRLVAWGSGVQSEIASITEVDSNKNVVFEVKMNKDMYPYSATKHPVPPGRPAAKVFLDEILEGNTYQYDTPTDSTGLKVTYTKVESFFYNSTEAHRFDYAPQDPVFEGGVYPNIKPIRVTLVQDGMTAHYGEFRFRTSVLGLSSIADRLTVFRRDSIGKGVFVAVPTRLNPLTMELVVDSMSAGEFVFGVMTDTVRQTLAPRLLSPIAGRRIGRGIRTALRFSPQGLYTHHRVVVYADSIGGEIVLDQRVSQDRAFGTFTKEGTYYWTVASENEGLSSQPTPSQVDSFKVVEFFMEILRPSEVAVWTHDSSYAISWETNAPGLMRLALMKSDTVVAVIKDSLQTSAQGFLWKVPVSVPVDSGYTLRASTIGPDSTSAVAESPFTITIRGLVSSVDETVASTTSTVAPNPVNTTLMIGGQEFINEILVFDGQGVLVYSSVVQATGAILDMGSLPSGGYHLVLRKGNRTEHHALRVMR